MNSATADTPKRPRGRPPGTTAIVMALRQDPKFTPIEHVTRHEISTPEAPPPDHRGGRRPGAGRPPRDPAARASWEAAQADRRVSEGRPERRGGYRPNAGRRKGDAARANETAAELAARHVQEAATLVARHRRELRAFVTRSKLTREAGQ